MASSRFGDAKDYNCTFKSNLLVALAAFWVNFCLLGVLRSNAVVFSGLVDVFGVNRQQAAWPSGIFGFFMSVTGAVSGFLTNFWSIQQLAVCGTLLAALSVSVCSFAYQMNLIILFYGALQGIGFGLVVPLTHVVLNQNFSKYRAFALGVSYAGSSVGSFLFPPISNYFIGAYDLDGTFLLLGGIMLNALLGALFYRSPPVRAATPAANNADRGPIVTVCKTDEKPVEDIAYSGRTKDSLKKGIFCQSDRHEKSKNESEKSTAQDSRPGHKFCNKQILASAIEVLTSVKFLVISLAYASYFSSSAIFLMVVLDFARDRGVEDSVSIFLVSAFSFGDLAGRLTCGWISDLKVIQRDTLVRLYLVAMGTLLAILPYVPSGTVAGIAVALGVINGGVIVNYSVLLHESLGIRNLPVAMGFSTCFVGMSAFLRPVVIGYFRDFHQSYDLLFVFLGLLQISIATVWFLELIIPLLFTVNKDGK